MDLHKDVTQKLNDSDGQIVIDTVKREAQLDMGELVEQFNQFMKFGMLKEALQIQWQIITGMTTTIVRLEKSNAMMDQDYAGRNR